ncbi:hypothetical protein I4U23_000202 [Adineta vaga]|nr:hypothetical protein I4U23_000202 [Adineta vaga]
MSLRLLEIARELSYWSPIVLCSIGLPGIILNLIIFLGTKSSRQSSIVYYIIGQSISDFGILLIILLQNYPSTSMSQSTISCKLSIYFSQLTVSCGMTFLCLSSFDRWSCTSRSVRIRQLSSIHMARYLFLISFLFWSLINLPYLFYCDINPYLNQCSFTNEFFAYISVYFLAPIFSTLLPLVILMIFGILTYKNIHYLNHFRNRTHLSIWEQQMTKMMIIQTILSIFCTLPRCIYLIYVISTVNEYLTRSFERIIIEYFIDQLTLFIITMNFASSFYIYFLSSSRLRKTIKTFLKNLFHLQNNQVIPISVQHTANPFTVTKHH